MFPGIINAFKHPTGTTNHKHIIVVNINVDVVTPKQVHIHTYIKKYSMSLTRHHCILGYGEMQS